MKIKDDFIGPNNSIEIISNQGKPTEFPREWQPVLGDCDMLVAIPDTHIYVHHSNLDNFKYGAQTMLDFVKYLGKLKTQFARQGKRLRIYQLGDLYELRFPSQGNPSANTTAAEIKMSNKLYSGLINALNSLRTHFLYGNHDFELRHFPGFRLGALEGKVYLEHGFAADTWEDFSNPTAKLWYPAQLAFLELRKVEDFFSKLLVAASVIRKDEHFAIGVPTGAKERSGMTAAADYPKKQREYYTTRLLKHTSGKETRVCIIGHTHRPFLDARVDGGNYIFVDAGAWTEGRSDFAVVTNEELAICRYRRAPQTRRMRRKTKR
jgi:UDP-2,3-diacylglucosamine pyrophosphatase LpxH